jgi:hypothetical protein
MIDPPPTLSISGISYFIERNIPFRLTASTESHVDSSVSATGLPNASIPALLNATSSLPKAATVCDTAFAQSSAFETSVLMKMASPPALRISSATLCPSSCLREAIATFAPSFAKSKAVVRPIPELPPVTSATFSRSFAKVLSRVTLLSRSLTRPQFSRAGRRDFSAQTSRKSFLEAAMRTG